MKIQNENRVPVAHGCVSLIRILFEKILRELKNQFITWSTAKIQKRFLLFYICTNINKKNNKRKSSTCCFFKYFKVYSKIDRAQMLKIFKKKKE